MERLTKRYNERTGTYEYVDAFSGAGIFDSIISGITSKFVKDTAKTLGKKALTAGVNKFGSEIGERAANKVISKVNDRFSKKPNPPKVNINIEDDTCARAHSCASDSDDESSKPLGNVIIKELNTDDNGLTKALNNINKKQYYGGSNKQFQSKLNKLLK